MAWTVPRTYVPGELVTASMLNTHVRDNLNELRGPVTGTAAITVGDFRGTEESITTTGTVHNLALGANTTVLRCNNASLLTITGITGGTAGRVVVIRAVSAVGRVELAHENVNSTAANRLANLATSAATPLAPAGALTNGGYAIYVYDGAQSRWNLIGHEQGAWIQPTFAAGDYTADGAMTWTVEAGDRTTQAYKLSGRQLTLIWGIATSTVGGTLSTQLLLGSNLLAGFTVTKYVANPIRAIDNSVETIGFADAVSGTSQVRLFRAGATNWAAATNTTGVHGLLTCDVT